MRVNESVVALSMQNMLFKDKTMVNSLNQRLKISKNEEEAVNLVINEKMKSQIRGLVEAEGDSRDDTTSLNEAINTVQDITGILGDIQEVLQAIQKKMSLREDYDNLSNRFNGLQQNFVDVSNSEIFNSIWFEDGLKTNQGIVSSDFNSCDIDEIKDLAKLYQNKLEQLEKINKEFKEKMDTGQITKVNMSAAETHVQNIATAEEIIGKTKDSIISEAKNAMLSQANQKPEQVINLLET